MGAPHHLAEFVDLVAQMRAKQNEYFRFKYRSFLEEAKRLEYTVDEYVKRYQMRNQSTSAAPGQTSFLDTHRNAEEL